MAQRIGLVIAFWRGRRSGCCTKIAYIGWGVGVPQLDFTGVSGHAMSAASVLTVAGYFIGSKYSKAGAIAAGALGYCAGVIVGLSRVMLGAHSPSEVLVGCALGGLIALAAIRIIRPRSAIVAAPVAFAVMGLILISTLHGERAPSEQLTTKAALYTPRPIRALYGRNALTAIRSAMKMKKRSRVRNLGFRVTVQLRQKALRRTRRQMLQPRNFAFDRLTLRLQSC